MNGGQYEEIQLADSGYGQGQVLVNPLHMACIYSASYIDYQHGRRCER